MEKIVYFTIGPSGAGKSTWASTKGLPMVSRDILREKLGFIQEGTKAVLGKKEEDLVTSEHNRIVSELISQGKSFILDNTNLNSKFLIPEIENFRKNGYKTVGVFFRTPTRTCIARRKGQVPPAVIIKMAENMKNISPDLFDETLEVK